MATVSFDSQESNKRKRRSGSHTSSESYRGLGGALALATALIIFAAEAAEAASSVVFTALVCRFKFEADMGSNRPCTPAAKAAVQLARTAAEGQSAAPPVRSHQMTHRDQQRS